MAKRIDRLVKKKTGPKLGFRSEPEITGLNQKKQQQ